MEEVLGGGQTGPNPKVAPKPLRLVGLNRAATNGMKGMETEVLASFSRAVTSGMKGIETDVLVGFSQAMTKSMKGMETDVLASFSRAVTSGMTGMETNVLANFTRAMTSGMKGVETDVLASFSQAMLTGIKASKGLDLGATAVRISEGLQETGSNLVPPDGVSAVAMQDLLTFALLVLLVAYLLAFSDAATHLAGQLAVEALDGVNSAAEWHVQTQNENALYNTTSQVLTGGLGSWLARLLRDRVRRPDEDGR